MKKLAIVSVAAIVLFLLPACGRSSGSSDIPSIDDGRRLFAAKCARCHGADGSGGLPIDGGVISADLRAQTLGEKYQFNMPLVSRAILDGIDNTGNALNNAMPRFRSQLSIADTKSLIVFLQSLRVPPEPPEEDSGADNGAPAPGGGTSVTPEIPQMRP